MSYYTPLSSATWGMPNGYNPLYNLAQTDGFYGCNSSVLSADSYTGSSNEHEGERRSQFGQLFLFVLSVSAAIVAVLMANKAHGAKNLKRYFDQGIMKVKGLYKPVLAK
jgi:hypothetical protein